MSKPMDSRPTATNAKVPGWPYVASAECPHEKHLGRPLANTTSSHELSHDGVVAHSPHGGKIETTVENAFREIKEGSRLSTRYAAATKLGFTEGRDTVGKQGMMGHGYDSASNRGSSCTGQLLVKNRRRESLKALINAYGASRWW
jgi:hypothetical protein